MPSRAGSTVGDPTGSYAAGWYGSRSGHSAGALARQIPNSPMPMKTTAPSVPQPMARPLTSA